MDQHRFPQAGDRKRAFLAATKLVPGDNSVECAGI
jgi:hypothetical protein